MPCVNHSPARKRAFTMIEMIMVIGVLGVLVAVSFGVFLGGRADAKEDRARADIQVIQQGLEAYRARFGDYPRIPSDYTGLGDVDTEKEYLLNALFGKIGPAHQAIGGIPSMVNSAILEFASPGLPMKDESDPEDSLKSNWFVDPWGNAYKYDYRPKDAGWLVFGYELRSLGPDGSEGTEDDIVAE